MAAARCQDERDQVQCQGSPALGQVSAALPPALAFLHEITEEFSLALPYQERGRLRLMKRLDMLNSLSAAGKCLHPKLNTEMCQYNACILSEGFLGTYRYMLCVF